MEATTEFHKKVSAEQWLFCICSLFPTKAFPLQFLYTQNSHWNKLDFEGIRSALLGWIVGYIHLYGLSLYFLRACRNIHMHMSRCENPILDLVL